MPDSHRDYALFLVLAPYICFIVAFLLSAILRRRHSKGAISLFWFVLCAEGFLISNYLGLVVGIEQWSLFFLKLENVIANMIPVSWLWFVFDFIEWREWRRFDRFWPYFALPLFTAVLVFTNDYHHLFWKGIRFVPIGDYEALQTSPGSLYYVVSFLNYAMILTGIAVIVREFIRGRSVYRRQLFWIAGGILIAIAANITFLLNLLPGIQKDPTPIGVAMGAMAFFVGIYRHRFLELNPTPRSRLFDALPDGLVVVDGGKTIIDMNQAAMAILGLSENDMGTAIHRSAFLAPAFDLLDAETEGEVSISKGQGENASFYEVRVDLLQERSAGRKRAVIVLRDVTERLRLSEEIRTLRGILPICARCKKIRDDEGFWQNVEAYVSKRSYAEFSHSLCPDCLRELYPDLMDKHGAAGD